MRATDHPFFDHAGPLAFAHRGGYEVAAENSLEAFDHAVGLGFRYLETDVQATRDGVLAVFHDPTLDRLTGRAGRIAEADWADLQALRLPGGERIPRIEDLLGAFPEARLNIDPKSDRAADLLLPVLAAQGALDRVCLGAFSDRRLDRLRRAGGTALATSMGPRDVARLASAAWRVPVGGFGAHCAQVPVRWGRVPVVTPGFLAAARRRGLHVHVWTVDDAAEMRALLDLGVDGLMTGRPSVLRRVLAERAGAG
jgi:glycerophosphoryl diester phosphodiesterase